MRVATSGLGHAYPPGPSLFTGVDVSLTGGDLVAVTGPSGSGKSTFLSILAGWTEPLQGTVHREGVGMVTWVPQNPVGVAQRATLDHAMLPLAARGMRHTEAEEQARAALDDFGLAGVADQRFGALSGGEAQRLMLARASLSPADLLLVDEPTAQLDPASAGAVISCLTHLAGEGRVVVIATHDPRVSAQCGRSVHLGVV